MIDDEKTEEVHDERRASAPRAATTRTPPARRRRRRRTTTRRSATPTSTRRCRPRRRRAAEAPRYELPRAAPHRRARAARLAQTARPTGLDSTPWLPPLPAASTASASRSSREREEARLNERTPQSHDDVRARAQRVERRRRLVLPAARPVADLPRARRRPARLGRRRQRAVRLPQRVRLDDPGPRAPRDRPRGAGALRAGHPLRRADRGRDRVAEELQRRFKLRALALHELGLRGDDGRDPDRARIRGPRHRDEDLRLLPRPPRHGDGLDRGRVRQDRRPREPRLAAVRRGHPERDRRDDHRGAVQRRAARWSAASSASTRRAASPPA